MSVGLLVNGPYALITTAVSTELGTHQSLRGSARALATVTAIIDGTGSIGNVKPFPMKHHKILGFYLTWMMTYRSGSWSSNCWNRF